MSFVTDASTLFRPFTTKALSLANRIVMAPMTRKFSPGGIPGENVARYYRRRAEGGVGLIITEGTTIDRLAASNDSSIPNIHDPASIVAWSNVVAQVHAAGAKIALQLWHQGLAREAGSGPHPDAPSEGPIAIDGVSRAMTYADIQKTILSYANAAKTAQDIGFDAVELHGAHGYLIDQFLWPTLNKRTDNYGGDIAGRTRFATQIIHAVRRAAGAHFPIIFRFSQWKVQDYSARLVNSPDELVSLLAPLRDAGVDVFHASSRRFWDPEFSGSSLNLAGWTRKLTGIPTISVGAVGRNDFEVPDRAEELIRRMESGEFDLIAVGRTLIGDPEWPLKLRMGRTNELTLFEREQLRSLN